MTRKRIRHERMRKESARKATLRKRKGGLFKKTAELCVLCEVEAAAILYNPGEPEPEVWPSMEEATRLMTKFMSIPETERNKRMETQETFLKERLQKVAEKAERARRKNEETEAMLTMNQIMTGDKELDDLEEEALEGLRRLAVQLVKRYREGDGVPSPAADIEDLLREGEEEGRDQGEGDGDAGGGLGDEEFLKDLVNDDWFTDTVAQLKEGTPKFPGSGGSSGTAGEAGPSGTKEDEAGPSWNKGAGESSSSSGTSFPTPPSPWPEFFDS